MATQRRINNPEKTHLDQPKTTSTQGDSDITPAVPSNIIAKLLAFTFAMIILPIGSYFLTRHSIFNGNATYAGAFAAFVANVVLIGYVIVAFQDDRSEREADERERKKQR
ncbi:hypothetical protein MBLNU230_g4669t1 [Neophaeotheca triangularis]